MTEQVLFETPSSSLWFYRLLGYNALALTAGSIYFAPQLLFEHEWAPFGMRLAVSCVLVTMGVGLFAAFHFFTKRNVFRVSLQQGKQLALTTLSMPLMTTRQLILPLNRIYPESRQGRWLRIYVQDANFVAPAAVEQKEPQELPQASGKYAKYQPTAEQKSEAAPTTLPKGVAMYYLERRGTFHAHKLLEDIVKGVYKF